MTITDNSLRERIIAAEGRIDSAVRLDYESFIGLGETILTLESLQKRCDKVMNNVLNELIRTRDTFAMGYIADAITAAREVYANKIRETLKDVEQRYPIDPY